MQFDSLAEAASHGMALAWHAARAPEREALVIGDSCLTFAELNAAANRFARYLQAHLDPGDGLAIISRNRREFPEAYFAGLRIGACLTPINWHLTADEMAYIIEDCRARAVLVDDELGTVARDLLPAIAHLDARIATGDAAPGYLRFDDVCGGQSAADIPAPLLGRQMLYTSGTTGRPKGVVRSPRGTFRHARRHNLPDHARVLCTGPLYHAAPLAQNLVQPLQQGKTVVVMERFDAEQALALIERHGITHSHMVATMFHRMLALPEDVRGRYDVSSIETIWHGAAPTPVHVKRAMIEWLGNKIDEYYAATETGGTEISAAEWLSRPGSVGRAEEGQEIAILDEAGNRLPPGEIGTIYFDAERSGGFHYHGDEQKTRSAYRGSLYTLGDQGYLDQDGYLFLTGRSAELIISGGVNIYPAEIDAVLLMHAAVQDAAVVGVPNEEFGEEVKAVVEAKPGAEPGDALGAELIAFCRERLAHYKCPKSVDFVERLPRSDAGKVFRKRVRDAYWGGVATAVLGVLAALALAALAVDFFYCPCGRLPGGWLLGERVEQPLTDWSFANDVPLCQVQVETGPLPHSVNLNCMASGGKLYLSCAGCDGKVWSSAALAHPEAQLRLAGKVYPVRLTRVDDPAELDAAWRARAQKTGRGLDAPREDGWWSFRAESR